MSACRHLVVALVASLSPPAPERVPPLWGDLRPGPHAVGFRVLARHDPSRAWGPGPAPAGRPVRVSVWYPAAPAAGAPRVRLGGYVAYQGGGAGFEEVNRALRERDLTGLRRALRGDDALRGLLDAPTAAVADAAPAAGRFPLVAYWSGLNDVGPSGAVLAEYLASHGFAVVTAPQLGTDYGRLGLGINPVDLETQVRDLEFAAAAAGDLPFVDRGRLAAAGHSMGGVAAVVFQMRHPEVAAVVGLDASYGSPGLKGALTASPYFRPGRMRVPLLDLRRADPGADLGALEALEYSDRHLLEFPGVAHADFTTFAMIAARFPTDIRGRTPEAARRGFESAARYAERFLDAALRRGEGGRAFLARRPEDNGVPPGVVRARFRKGLPAPPPAEEFARVTERGGLAGGLRLLGEWRGRLPGRDVVDEAGLNALGYDFLARGRPAVAVDLFRLNAEAHPDSANARDSLAEGYLAAGDRPSAARAYQAVLEVLPRDKGPAAAKDALRRNAEAKLKELRGGQ